ncbi:hypothetical protein HYFRA_00002789 [Hymenoscyphus fraxineus]|uniref:Uncharacterized protein n=1 Tax=Hymenoscyphus fraxineus TaxID=746836 RepID=A0A9N9KR32_9HELO|nr:hypothetical protein HYFRA_00002789 [Hymenoscyphus fraxineus]
MKSQLPEISWNVEQQNHPPSDSDKNNAVIVRDTRNFNSFSQLGCVNLIANFRWEGRQDVIVPKLNSVMLKSAMREVYQVASSLLARIIVKVRRRMPAPHAL